MNGTSTSAGSTSTSGGKSSTSGGGTLTPATSTDSVELKGGYHRPLLTIEDVRNDFKLSYVGALDFTRVQKTHPKPKWNVPKEAIYDWKKVPKGWTRMDDDVDRKLVCR